MRGEARKRGKERRQRKQRRRRETGEAADLEDDDEGKVHHCLHRGGLEQLVEPQHHSHEQRRRSGRFGRLGRRSRVEVFLQLDQRDVAGAVLVDLREERGEVLRARLEAQHAQRSAELLLVDLAVAVLVPQVEELSEPLALLRERLPQRTLRSGG